jgi:Protein of unknown function (DUF2690)
MKILRIQRRWMKKRAWLVGIFLSLVVIFLFSSVPALASSGPQTARHLKPLASHILGTSPLVRAATCSGNGCNGLDPYSTGCAASMYTIVVASVGSIGHVELEYSTICQTNWDQIYGNGVEYLAGCVVRKAGPDGPVASKCYSSTQYSWINTNMLWSPHNLDDASGCLMEICRGGPSGQISGYYAETGYY